MIHPHTPSPSSPPLPKLAIDPSIGSLGWCLMDSDLTIRRAGFIKQETDRDVEYRARAFWMTQQVAQVAALAADEEDSRLDVIIEAPNNWHDQRGQASKDNNAVQKLYLEVGCLIGTLAAQDCVASIHTVEPMQWKGQTPKRNMVRRSEEFAGRQGIMLGKDVPHDTHEAILLAEFAVGKCRGACKYHDPLAIVYEKGIVPSMAGVFVQQEFVDRD